jgi:uncharacterized protein YjiS (DUF1127 family)
MNQTFTLGRRDSVVPILPLHRSPTEASLWQRLAKLFRSGNERLQTISQLNRLSDEQLRDIGVDRFDIESSVDALIANRDQEARRIPR